MPASKTDPTAQGVTRALACACPSKLCPVWAMRAVITAAELTRQNCVPMRAPNLHPLIGKVDGSSMTKEEVIEFYVEMAAFVGAENLRITGHSCRVAGAKRMALAGHPIWTIQVFGRWGSNAILGYVREALLGYKGGNLAQQTEQAASSRMSIKGIRKMVGKAIEDTPSAEVLSGEAKHAMLEMVLEHVSDLLQAAGPYAIEELEAEITLKTNGIWAFVVSELRLGRAKIIRNSRGKIHVIFNDETAVCGWTWAGQRVEILRQNVPTAGVTAGWCKRCHAWALALACAS